MFTLQNSSAENPFKDVESGGGAAALIREAGTVVQKFKSAIKGDELSIRAYKGYMNDAVNIIESLMKLKNPQSSIAGRAEENPTMAKILQEIRTIKTTITQTQNHVQQGGNSWAKIASKSEAAGTTIRIQDENEKKEIAKLSSEELVKKIGRSEIVGAKQMSNGQVRVYFAGQDSKELMEREKEWTSKLAATARVASPTYQVLIHDMPLTFQPENSEHLKMLQQANVLYLQGIRIHRAAWLKRTPQPNKTAGSLIVWFEDAEIADKAIAKGIMWQFEVKATEIFRSGFRALQCFNCQKYGHIAKVCTSEVRCGQCAKAHNTRECTEKQEVRCCNCNRKHASWHQSCPVRIAARAKATLSRTQDPGRYKQPDVQPRDPENDWQIVGSRKRRVGAAGAQIVGADGEVIFRRRPGRPRKTSADIAVIPPAWAKMPTVQGNETRPVTRETQAENGSAPPCQMTQ